MMFWMKRMKMMFWLKKINVAGQMKWQNVSIKSVLYVMKEIVFMPLDVSNVSVSNVIRIEVILIY